MNETIITSVVTVIGIAVGAALTIYQIKRTIPLKRSSLQHDLATLKLAKELGFPANALQDDVVQRLAKFELHYRPPKLRDPGKVIMQSVFGVLLALGLGYWTYYLSRDGFNPWSVLTGIFTISALAQPFVALEEGKRNAEKAELTESKTRSSHAEPGAAPNAGPATQPGNSGVTERPPSVS